MVGENDRLSPLQMRVAGEHRRLVTLGQSEECGHQVAHARLMAGYRRPKVQLKVEGDLVVSAASRVYLASDRPHQFGQAPLDGHMDVLVFQCPPERAPFDLARDGGQTRQQRIALLFAEDVDRRQHADMRLRPLDIEGGKHMIERDGGVQPLEQRVLAPGEPSTPQLVAAATALSRRHIPPLACRSVTQRSPCRLRAQTSRGRPQRWMKPLADS